MYIKIGSKTHKVVRVLHRTSYLPAVELENGSYWYVAKDKEHAGEIACQYWDDWRKQDPEGIASEIGHDVLIQWGLLLGATIKAGYTDGKKEVVYSYPQWLGLWRKKPEKLWAQDGRERIATVTKDLLVALWPELKKSRKKKVVAYRYDDMILI